MNIGMLWFDDSSKPLSEKVRQAVQYYAAKYGRTPTHCLVNPETTATTDEVDNVRVVAATTVMPDHFWVGFDEQRVNGSKKTKAKAAARQKAA